MPKTTVVVRQLVMVACYGSGSAVGGGQPHDEDDDGHDDDDDGHDDDDGDGHDGGHDDDENDDGDGDGDEE
jgi:hypothetical protein